MSAVVPPHPPPTSRQFVIKWVASCPSCQPGHIRILGHCWLSPPSSLPLTSTPLINMKYCHLCWNQVERRETPLQIYQIFQRLPVAPLYRIYGLTTFFIVFKVNWFISCQIFLLISITTSGEARLQNWVRVLRGEVRSGECIVVMTDVCLKNCHHREGQMFSLFSQAASADV